MYKITKIDVERLDDKNISHNKLDHISSILIVIIITIISLVFLLYGSSMVTNAAVFIAQSFGLSELIIAGTIIAVGTSLPELVMSIQAVRQNQFDLMVGNIVGSNIINTLLILGISVLVGNIHVGKDAIMYLHINSLASILLLMGFTLFVPRVFKRWQAVPLLIGYVIFLLLSLN